MSDSKSSSSSCVVVGVGEGLGAALARRFAAGYKVALLARSAEVTGKVSAEIAADGGTALPIQSDATVECKLPPHTTASSASWVQSRSLSTTAAAARWDG